MTAEPFSNTTVTDPRSAADDGAPERAALPMASWVTGGVAGRVGASAVIVSVWATGANE